MKIESSQKLKPLKQEHYEALLPYYANYNSEISDLNLTNLLLWRSRHDIHFLELGGYLWIAYYPTDPFYARFSEPIGDYTQIEALVSATGIWFEFCKENEFSPRLRHIGNQYKNFLEGTKYSFEFKSDDGDFDYVYLSGNLATLSGNKFHKKKNHLNQFQKRYHERYRIEPIDASNAEAAFRASKDWCIANGCGEKLDLCHEYNGIYDILHSWENQQRRGLEGMVIFIDDHPMALTFGEFIANDTFLVHIEKANQEIQGLYAAINHAMANHVVGRCTYINREQDMGIEGLRKAKLSYHPHHMSDKYDARIK